MNRTSEKSNSGKESGPSEPGFIARWAQKVDATPPGEFTVVLWTLYGFIIYPIETVVVWALLFYWSMFGSFKTACLAVLAGVLGGYYGWLPGWWFVA